MLGMYIHTHWGYRHPYAARTWTLDDWRGYLEGLHGLGYDAIMVWPLLDTIPSEPTPSDVAFLDKLRQVIETAHQRFGMTVIITACPNIAANARANTYTFEERPYFVCEKKLNPRDTATVETWLAARQRLFEPLKNADALAVIDSDPGGYIGSTNEEFVILCRGQIDAFRSHNPQAAFVYWMLAGWENYNRFWERSQDNAATHMWTENDWRADCFDSTLALMRARIPEPWWVFNWLPAHQNALGTLGLQEKMCYFPYGVIEGEPTFPTTNCNPVGVGKALPVEMLKRQRRGVMANAQTHCMQLPNTYFFAHASRGGTQETADLEGFAAEVLPGLSQLVAQAWACLETGPVAQKTRLAGEVRSQIGKTHPTGRLGGLLFGSTDRFLNDLAMNLELRAAFMKLRSASGGSDRVPKAVRGALQAVKAVQTQTGFVDAGEGPIHEGFYQPLSELHDPEIDRVLALYNDWRNPAVRNGLLVRLCSVVEDYCQSQGV